MAGITDRQRSTSTRSRHAANLEANLELAKAVADFSVAFERWSRSLIEADAPSLPRLKLLYALHCEGPQRMGDLADALEVTPRSVTALVDGLEAQGQVRRVPDPSDRRATIIELVEGQSDVEGRYRDHALAVARLFDNLDTRDRETFLRICRQVTARLRSHDLPAR
ncbi:MAG: MarR family transcriptional regulator [Chloroflexota bacterium]|nr:MarR family transcriptional regulator [Chloroflexota bacterium]